MSELLQLPYFTQEAQSINYLNHQYADITGLDLDSPSGERFLLAEGICVRKPVLPDVLSSGRKVVVLEPHCDDLALSASGYVMDAIQSGGSCQSINIFSKTAIDRFPWGDKVSITEVEFENLRLQESGIAVQNFLGQSFTSLGLPLASKRGYQEIFADSHHDIDLVRNVGNVVVSDVIDLGANVILSPLAVQGHVDHLVTFDVGMFVKEALGDQVELILYEDYPYTRNKAAYSERLKEVQNMHVLQQEYLPVDSFLSSMADMAIIYRSQFDDLNRDQMHAIMREDLRAVALEANAHGFRTEAECAQRYWRVV